MKVHEKIRLIRTQKNLTQENMAEKLGISTNGYSKIEQGKTKLNLERIGQIVSVLDIDILELISTNEERGIFFVINENGKNQGANFYQNADETVNQQEKLQLIINHKEEIIQQKNELLMQKDNELKALKQLLEIFQKQR